MNIIRSADLSPCGRFRWRLDRSWGKPKRVGWLMLNPSMADGNRDDPTLATITMLTNAWGAGGLSVVNVVPYRSSDPSEMTSWLFPAQGTVGEWLRKRALLDNNISKIRAVCDASDMLVVAFGNPPKCMQQTPEHTSRGHSLIVEAVDAFRVGHHGPRRDVYCLGVTKLGYPIHPAARGKSRIPRDAVAIPYEPNLKVSIL